MMTNISRNFLCTESNKFSRKALVAWDKSCTLKSARELNILDLFRWNKVVICKLLWAMTQKKDKLWIQWIHIIYINEKHMMQMTTPKQPC